MQVKAGKTMKMFVSKAKMNRICFSRGLNSHWTIFVVEQEREAESQQQRLHKTSVILSCVSLTIHEIYEAHKNSTEF